MVGKVVRMEVDREALTQERKKHDNRCANQPHLHALPADVFANMADGSTGSKFRRFFWKPKEEGRVVLQNLLHAKPGT